MGGFGGDLTDYGQTTSLEGKNIGANYRAPKEEFELSQDIEEFSSLQDLLDVLPQNWFEENNDDNWVDDLEFFWGKDGQTNAYVKQGLDDELVEVLPRQQTDRMTWRFATDDNHVDFKGGGKVYAKGREWFIVKVITQDTTSTIPNKYNSMDTSPNNKRLLRYGLKTLVLI